MQPSATRAIRYCASVAATALLLLAAVAACNAIVDPFGMYPLINIDGLNVYKPSIYTRVRLFKAYEVRRVRPQSIILGSSRTHIGLRCSHPAWEHLEEPCYNLAFDGATTREMYAYLRHAQAVRPLRHVLLGLDTYHLTNDPSATRPDFDPLVLFNPERLALPVFITGDLRLLTSLDTLRASIATVTAQNVAEPSWFAPDGQRRGEVFFRQVDADFMHSGPRAYFDKIDRREVGFQTEGLIPATSKRAHLVTDPPGDPEETSLAYIRRIIEFCRPRNIDLRIFITPSHVHQLEITAATGAWQMIEDGKRNLVRLVDAEATRHPDQTPVPIFDFSGYSAITEDPLPRAGSRDEMRYYWDSSHFKQIVGDYVLERVYNLSDGARRVPEDFGVRMTAANIETVLAQQRAQQLDYRARFPNDITTLRGLVDGALHNKTAAR